MNRFHVHVAVEDLDSNIRFYSAMFGVEPSVHKDDYAKWMLDDPRINFAISRRGSHAGVNHLGIQVDSDEDLDAMRERLARAEISATQTNEAACCYARSNKYWTTDPQGIAWETFRSLSSIPVFGEDEARRRPTGNAGSASCIPLAQADFAAQVAPSAAKPACCP